MLDSSAIDTICFQEIQTFRQLSILKKTMRKYKYIAYQRFLYGPKGGLVIFSKVPLESIKYIQYSNLGSLYNTTIYSRIVRNGILLCKIKNTAITILNTHLTSDFYFKWTPKNKLYPTVKSQVMEAASLINKLSVENKTLILAGDFNMGKDTKLYNAFIKATNMTDPFKLFSIPTYQVEKLHYFFKAKRSARIDYVFFKKGSEQLEVTGTTHMFDKRLRLKNNQLSFLSDHIGLKADLKFSYK